VTLALLVRSIPIEYREEFFTSLYGKAGEPPEETVHVAGADIAKDALDVMRDMQAKKKARADATDQLDAALDRLQGSSRTDPEPEK
jgi:hypothetical protein